MSKTRDDFYETHLLTQKPSIAFFNTYFIKAPYALLLYPDSESEVTSTSEVRTFYKACFVQNKKLVLTQDDALKEVPMGSFTPDEIKASIANRDNKLMRILDPHATLKKMIDYKGKIGLDNVPKVLITNLVLPYLDKASLFSFLQTNSTLYQTVTEGNHFLCEDRALATSLKALLREAQSFTEESKPHILSWMKTLVPSLTSRQIENQKKFAHAFKLKDVDQVEKILTHIEQGRTISHHELVFLKDYLGIIDLVLKPNQELVTTSSVSSSPHFIRIGKIKTLMSRILSESKVHIASRNDPHEILSVTKEPHQLLRDEIINLFLKSISLIRKSYRQELGKIGKLKKRTPDQIYPPFLSHLDELDEILENIKKNKIVLEKAADYIFYLDDISSLKRIIKSYLHMPSIVYIYRKLLNIELSLGIASIYVESPIPFSSSSRLGMISENARSFLNYAKRREENFLKTYQKYKMDYAKRGDGENVILTSLRMQTCKSPIMEDLEKIICEVSQRKINSDLFFSLVSFLTIDPFEDFYTRDQSLQELARFLCEDTSFDFAEIFATYQKHQFDLSGLFSIAWKLIGEFLICCYLNLSKLEKIDAETICQISPFLIRNFLRDNRINSISWLFTRECASYCRTHCPKDERTNIFYLDYLPVAHTHPTLFNRSLNSFDENQQKDILECLNPMITKPGKRSQWTQLITQLFEEKTTQHKELIEKQLINLLSTSRKIPLPTLWCVPREKMETLSVYTLRDEKQTDRQNALSLLLYACQNQRWELASALTKQTAWIPHFNYLCQHNDMLGSLFGTEEGTQICKNMYDTTVKSECNIQLKNEIDHIKRILEPFFNPDQCRFKKSIR